MERLSISSFLANGHEYRLFVYDDVEGTPDGVKIEDANAIIPESEIFKVGWLGRRAELYLLAYHSAIGRAGAHPGSEIRAIPPPGAH